MKIGWSLIKILNPNILKAFLKNGMKLLKSKIHILNVLSSSSSVNTQGAAAPLRRAVTWEIISENTPAWDPLVAKSATKHLHRVVT